MEHLSLEIFDTSGTGSKYAVLPDDTAITITETSEVFASGDIWSHSFRLEVGANAHIFGSAGDIHGSRLHEQVDRRRARLWVEGVPMFMGYLMLDDEVDVGEDGYVDVRFESGQKTFNDMIDGAKANQVPTMDDVLIGMALWRKRWTRCRARLTASAPVYDGSRTVTGDLSDKDLNDVFVFEADGEKEGNSVQEYPRMVFPKGQFGIHGTEGTEPVDCINTDEPYTEDENGTPTHPYCNVALCYQRYGYEKKDQNGAVKEDYSAEPEAQRGYEYMPADRVNSAPNFYVIYWIRSLMKHLGIHVEENQMLGVEDLRRLFFVNTNCAYDEPDKLRNVATTERYGKYKRGDQRLLIPEYLHPETAVNIEESGFVGKNVGKTADSHISGDITVKVKEVLPWTEQDRQDYLDYNNYFHKAYATSECFPDVDISEVIKALENGFGVRFLFSDDYKRVRIVLLRNIFRDSEVQDIRCDIIGETKRENNIRGFRMTYGGSDDTAFRYKGFDDKLPHKKELWADSSDTHDYSHWKLDAQYGDIINRISAFDKTCYVTPKTGNAYGIKIDKDAKRYDDLHPSLFEFAGYMDAEDGDCTGDESTIHTVEAGFVPAIMNDLNMEAERDKGEGAGQVFALFVDEEMRPRRPDPDDGTDHNKSESVYNVERILYAKDVDGNYVNARMMDGGIVKPGEFAIASDMFAAASDIYATLVGTYGLVPVLETVHFDIDGHINEGYRLYLQDNYEPNDTGISPVESHDWGLTLGIMRGSGGDATVNYEYDPDDGEGNDTWERAAGSSVTAHPDTCDNYGNRWDYNGTVSGLGDDGDRLSLKLRAEKPNPKYDPLKPEDSEENPRYLQITDNNLRGRGLADRMYKEYSYWVRNARIVEDKARMELAQLMAIDKTKKVKVGDVTGFIRKMQYPVSIKKGLGDVTMEILYI